MPRAVELQRSAGLTTGRRGDQARDRWFLCLRFGLRTDRSAARALFGLLAPFIADARYHKAICPVAKLGQASSCSGWPEKSGSLTGTNRQRTRIVLRPCVSAGGNKNSSSRQRRLEVWTTWTGGNSST